MDTPICGDWGYTRLLYTNAWYTLPDKCTIYNFEWYYSETC